MAVISAMDQVQASGSMNFLGL